MSDKPEQKNLIDTEPRKRLDAKQAKYLKTIEELKAWQETERLKKELGEMMEE